jgi:hypothetical protein
MLDKLDVSQVGANAETWEKVVRNLRAGMMPPAGEALRNRQASKGCWRDCEERAIPDEREPGGDGDAEAVAESARRNGQAEEKESRCLLPRKHIPQRTLQVHRVLLKDVHPVSFPRRFLKADRSCVNRTGQITHQR